MDSCPRNTLSPTFADASRTFKELLIAIQSRLKCPAVLAAPPGIDVGAEAQSVLTAGRLGSKGASPGGPNTWSHIFQLLRRLRMHGSHEMRCLMV